MSQNSLILSVRNADISYAEKPIFSDLTFHIHAGEKISLVGKNGAGKTTLIKIITKNITPDSGERWEIPALNVGYLQQDMSYAEDMTVFEYIYQGLAKDKQTEEYHYMVDMVSEPLDLKKDALLSTLSGGQLRRCFLGRSLVEEPDILLLDEPTNHLDLAAIEWLEDFLKYYRGAVLCISHDRTFLANMSDKVFWLDRGQLRVCPYGFSKFGQWQSEMLDQEARELHNREKSLAEEIEWASRGVKARRKRNQRRLENVSIERERLKKDQSAFRNVTSSIHIAPPKNIPLPSNIIADFHKIHKVFTKPSGEEVTILKDLSFRLFKGDRIGILGNNGSGKSSFIKILLKEIEPDKGKVKLAKTVNISYFDQHRIDLQQNKTLWSTLCPTGGEYVNVGGKMRHVCGYLKSFMFDPKRARDEVYTLSGGQQNRLILAKVLANPGNLLILDEPTNDLDMETLDMLEELLCNYKGTLLIVSHDRSFLDQIVTKTLAFEGDGKIECHIGGYSDYQNFKKSQEAAHIPAAPIKEKKKKISNDTTTPKVKTKTKIPYKVKFEYEQLPQKIKDSEEIISKCECILCDADLFMKNPDLFSETSKQLQEHKLLLENHEMRYLELDELVNPKAD